MTGLAKKTPRKAVVRRRAWNVIPQNIPKSQQLQTITYGLRSLKVKQNTLIRPAFSKKAERFLHLPDYCVRKQRRGSTLYFGPSIAIYALPGKQSLFGPQTNLFREMALIAKNQGVDLFVVTPGHLQYEQRQTLGYRYYPSKRRWRLEICPWPDFVWRRAVQRPLRFRKQMDVDEMILTNKSVIGTLPRTQSEKWLLHTMLSKSQAVLPFLLPVTLIQSPYDLIKAVHQLGDVYVKPVRGTQGQQIVRIVEENSRYIVTRANSDRFDYAHGEVLATDQDLLRRFVRLTMSTPFIAQRTVHMMRTMSNEPFDLRYLIQASADGGDSAVCTAIVARVAPSESVTTNLHTGAIPLSIEDLLKRMPDHRVALLLQAIERGQTAAIAAFHAIANQHVALVELGVDIAVDRQGRAFILEVNPCPGRQMYRRINPELRRLSLHRVLEYAVFSTDFLRGVKEADQQ